MLRLTKNINSYSSLKISQAFKKTFSTNTFFDLTPLTTLSPLDGRYSTQIAPLRNYFSEAGLIKYRTIVEIEWLKFIVTKVISENDLKQKFQINSETEIRETVRKLDMILKEFELDNAKKVKEIENKTNHDVKSVEYFIKDEMRKRNINNHLCELVHFCCTSEDINNLAWSLMIKDSLNFVYHPKLTSLIQVLARMAEDHYNVPMMSRTHGQPATPTTAGKEIANYAFRLNEQHYLMRGMKIKGKINGAVGNFNSHYAVLPEVDWVEKSRMFIEKIGLEWNPYTTQIENHDSICAVFSKTSLINSILIGLSRDFWGYISLNYFRQKLNKDEVGSSTMPHKVIFNIEGI
jgi:adenylosuccinate lyase